MRDIDFGKPYMYNITFADGRSVNVHHSYVLRYEHRTAPNLIKNGQLQGWGYAEGAHILNELSRDDQLKSSIQTLVNKSLIEVIKMAGMRAVFMGTDEGNEEQLTRRLEMVNWGRSYNSLTFLDKDDEYSQNTFGGLSGLSDLLQQNMWLISAALEMQGILYGDLRGGFSQAADDMKRYAKTILNRCNTLYRPVLTKFLKVLFIVYDIKGGLDFEFNSINQMEENNETIDSMDKFVGILDKLNEKGLISQYQMAKSMKEFIQKNKISIAISDVQLNRLKLEEEEELLKAFKKLGKGETPSSNSGEYSEEEDLDSELGLEENADLDLNLGGEEGGVDVGNEPSETNE
jgi:phage-related protein (TIGR01555 family)